MGFITGVRRTFLVRKAPDGFGWVQAALSRFAGKWCKKVQSGAKTGNTTASSPGWNSGVYHFFTFSLPQWCLLAELTGVRRSWVEFGGIQWGRGNAEWKIEVERNGPNQSDLVRSGTGQM
jgi:hypothetical protein